MKAISEKFTNIEFDKLRAKKGKKSWHDFILDLAGVEKNGE
jgi:hypothetical protein